MPRFRVICRRTLPDGSEHVEFRLYTEALTAAEAKAQVNRSHKRGRLGRVVSTTAIADAQGQPGVWSI